MLTAININIGNGIRDRKQPDQVRVRLLLQCARAERAPVWHAVIAHARGQVDTDVRVDHAPRRRRRNGPLQERPQVFSIAGEHMEVLREHHVEPTHDSMELL